MLTVRPPAFRPAARRLALGLLALAGAALAPLLAPPRRKRTPSSSTATPR
ncbi:hypothetical protein UCD39_11500 [Nitrospirillum sp. BR 11752]|nr:hypothetical protein [Nitrospirillum sp. BR 11752]